ncbi:hypothetical protein I4U23_012852 [Adineta vaga]|nr:hypothetical protein I4U23_012852 [Adineta vaga]
MSKTVDSNNIKLQLHYWDVRGRVQACRYILEDIAYANKNVDYKEDFELIESMMTTWAEHKADQTISGPFRTLPVLHWNDKQVFGQTLTIAHLLARKFNLYGKITSSINDPILLEAYLNGVVSCAYTDVIVNACKAIWESVDIENKESVAYYQIMGVRDNIASLNTLLKQSSTTFFYDQTEPTIADYFAFEAYLTARDIHSVFLPTDCEALVKLEQTMKQRPALAEYFKNNRLFKRFTAASHEEEYLEKISKIK